jgi:hypothetical protein
MQFQASITVTGGVVGPDPVASPGTVPAGSLLVLPVRSTYEAEFWDTLGLSFYQAGAPAATVDGELWALDEATAGGPPASRVFYFVGNVTLRNQTLTSVTLPVSGPLYFRQTGDGMVALSTGTVSASLF